jgi:hypothetical protein
VVRDDDHATGIERVEERDEPTADVRVLRFLERSDRAVRRLVRIDRINVLGRLRSCLRTRPT